MSPLACHDCDLVQNLPPVPARASARCVRCGAVLFRSRPDSINRTLALILAGVVLYTVACTFPFLGMRQGSIVQKTSLFTGIINLYKQDLGDVAILVLITCVLVPLAQMLGLLYILLPLRWNRSARYSMRVFRLSLTLGTWGMMEVFLIGILVSMVKLGKMATMVPGIGAFAFAALVFVLTAALSSLDPHMIWERLERNA